MNKDMIFEQFGARVAETAATQLSRRAILKLGGLLASGEALNTPVGQLFMKIVGAFTGKMDYPGGSLGGEIPERDPIMSAAGTPFRKYSEAQYQRELNLLLELQERFRSIVKLNKLRHIAAAYQQQNFERYKQNDIAYIPDDPPLFSDFLRDQALLRKLFSPAEVPNDELWQRMDNPALHTASGLIKDNDGMITPTALLLMLPALFPDYPEIPPQIPVSADHHNTIDYILKNPAIVQRYGYNDSLQDLVAAIAAPGQYQNMNHWQFSNNAGEVLELHCQTYGYQEGDSPLWPDRELTPGTTIIVTPPDTKKVTAYSIIGKKGGGNSAQYLIVSTGMDGDYSDRDVQRGFGQLQFTTYDQASLLHAIAHPSVRKVFTIRRALVKT